jgi:hypothetical protein
MSFVSKIIACISKSKRAHIKRDKFLRVSNISLHLTFSWYHCFGQVVAHVSSYDEGNNWVDISIVHPRFI